MLYSYSCICKGKDKGCHVCEGTGMVKKSTPTHQKLVISKRAKKTDNLYSISVRALDTNGGRSAKINKTQQPHQGLIKAVKAPAYRGTSTPNSSPDQNSAPAQNEKSLDAKNGWHALRDHGQFGSYPSHDDMGDESAP